MLFVVCQPVSFADLNNTLHQRAMRQPHSCCLSLVTLPDCSTDGTQGSHCSLLALLTCSCGVSWCYAATMHWVEQWTVRDAIFPLVFSLPETCLLLTLNGIAVHNSSCASIVLCAKVLCVSVMSAILAAWAI